MRCDKCGRFIGYSEFDREEINIDWYAPYYDYEHEVMVAEELHYTHKKCLDRKTHEEDRGNARRDT